PIPTSSSVPTSITSGPDGNLWFTEQATNKIGRITTAGSITEFAIPGCKGPNTGGPTSITAGPDGNLWFTLFFANRIAKMTTSGVITAVFTAPTTGTLTSITLGPDGNLWFVEGFKVGKITTGGSI